MIHWHVRWSLVLGNLALVSIHTSVAGYDVGKTFVTNHSKDAKWCFLARFIKDNRRTCHCTSPHLVGGIFSGFNASILDLRVVRPGSQETTNELLARDCRATW